MIENKQSTTLNLLTLQETANGTLSDQIKNVTRFVFLGGRKLMGLICRPHHPPPSDTMITNPTEKFQTKKEHRLTSTESAPMTSIEDSSLTSTSEEVIAARVFASAAMGLALGGLPGAIACSGATLTGIQIKRALTSHKDKILYPLAFIAINLAAVTLPDAEEIYTAYSEGRYSDALMTILTKAPANLVIGAILQILIQSNIATLANHWLPEAIKPKNNQLTSATCNGVSDAIALYFTPTLRTHITKIAHSFFRFPTVESLPLSENPFTVYSAPIGIDNLQANGTALGIQANFSKWLYPPAWTSYDIDWHFNFLQPNEESLINLTEQSNQIQGILTFSQNCLSEEVHYKIHLNDKHIFNFSASNATIDDILEPQNKILYKLHFLLLSEEKISILKITFSPLSLHNCTSKLLPLELSNLTNPYDLKISPTEIQYYITHVSPTPPTPRPTSHPNTSHWSYELLIYGIAGTAVAFLFFIYIYRVCIKNRSCIVNRQHSNERIPLINNNIPLDNF